MFSNPSRVYRIGARRGVARCGSVRERLLKDGVVAVGLAASRRRPVLEDQSVGGTRADEVTARLFAAKASIVSEHHKAAARARVAKEAARLERGSGSRDSLRSAGSQGTTLSENESELHETESDGERDGDDDEGLGVDERELPAGARVAGSVSAGAIESRGAFENVGVSEETLRRRVNVHKSSAVGGRE